MGIRCKSGTVPAAVTCTYAQATQPPETGRQPQSGTKSEDLPELPCPPFGNKRNNTITMLRLLLYVGAWACVLPLCGQIQFGSASVTTQELNIEGLQRPDSLDARASRGTSLGILLARQGWNLRATGASGQSQQLRVGGFSPDHVAVYWQGLEINSLTLGSADLSLLPAFLFPGATFSRLPTADFAPDGAIAGAVQLSPQASSPRLRAAWTGNSLENTTAGLALRTQGAQNGRSETALHLTWANNRFEFQDQFKPGQPTETQRFNNHRMAHVMHGWTRALSGDLVLRVQGWAFGRTLQIPPTEGSYGTAHADQREAGLRSSAVLKHIGDRPWEISMAHGVEHFGYDYRTCDTCDVEVLSDIPTHQTVLRGWKQLDAQELRLFTRLSRRSIASANHGNRTEYRPLIGFDWSKIRNLNVTGVYVVAPHSLPQITVTYDNDLCRRNRFSPVSRIQIGHRSRLPDFNERYWNPGGNPDLLPERGWTLALAHTQQGPLFSYGIELNSRRLFNAIAWIFDGEQNAWTPINQDHARHAALVLRGNFKQGPLAIKLNLTGQHGEVQDEAGGWTPAPFLPALMVNLHAEWQQDWGDVFLAVQSQSAQNTALEDVADVDGFALIDLGLGHTFRNQLRLEAEVRNLLNTHYRLVYGYPMPGRVLQINLLCSLY